MQLSRGVTTACDDQGCDVDVLVDGRRTRVSYSNAVRNAVEVRPGDLVALVVDAIVWRWRRSGVANRRRGRTIG